MQNVYYRLVNMDLNLTFFRLTMQREEYLKKESEVMKDVPGWKVGENVYKTRKFMPPGQKSSLYDHDL